MLAELLPYTLACQQVIRERDTARDARDATDTCRGCLNEHYHLDSESFVKQLGVDLACCVLGVSSQLWADQYSLQRDNFTETRGL